jgi:tRNA(Leu) C34 or U34 (ribose-2'-O)-methylase TrmL
MTSLIADGISSNGQQDVITVRYSYQGQHVSKGASVDIAYIDSYKETRKIPGEIVYNTLKNNTFIDPSYHLVLCYNYQLHGWHKLDTTSSIILKENEHRIDIIIENMYQMALPPNSQIYQKFNDIQNTGEPGFSIGIFQGKTAFNVVKLRKIATQFNAKCIFVIHPRYKDRKPFEEADKELLDLCPFVEYIDFNDFAMKLEEGWVCVGIEMGGTPLTEFQHPRKAIYILGAEDNGVSSLAQKACKYIIEIPSVRSESFNVTCAGSIIMYDRHLKNLT